MAILKKIGQAFKGIFGVQSPRLHKPKRRVESPRLNFPYARPRRTDYPYGEPVLGVSQERQESGGTYDPRASQRRIERINRGLMEVEERILEEAEEPLAIADEGQVAPVAEGVRPPRTVDNAEWHMLLSTNIDRVRYGVEDRVMEMVTKKGRAYRVYDVEFETFRALLTAPSPGQFWHYVIIQYGYRVERMSGTHGIVSGVDQFRTEYSPFEGEAYAVPENIQAIQRAAGRTPVDGFPWNTGEPVAQGVRPPPGGWSFR